MAFFLMLARILILERKMSQNPKEYQLSDRVGKLTAYGKSCRSKLNIYAFLISTYYFIQIYTYIHKCIYVYGMYNATSISHLPSA